MNEDKLKQETQEFFKRYWNPINGKPPEWSAHWEFNGTIPNNEKRGCYALFKGPEIIYIGSGLGKSFGNYHSSGLGDRLKRYWQLDKDIPATARYKPRDDWTGLTSILTIGFEDEHYHLAAALEIYLINMLKPIQNFHHT